MTNLKSIRYLSAGICLVGGLAGCTVHAPLGGYDLQRMVWADRLIEAAIEKRDIPGAVLLVGRDDRILYRKAYGYRAVQPEKLEMTVDTIFDLASLSKPVGCATSIMLLVERGQLNLTDCVSDYIPAFAANGKEHITVEQLLLHRSGLTPDNQISDYEGNPTESLANIYNLAPVYKPGFCFKYSDVGYIVLGELVRVVDGRALDQFATKEIFEPMQMKDTAYNPPDTWRPYIAPTEQREGRWMLGEVHDPRAYALGGVAGHAGLFSTADDLAKYCQMILNGGTWHGRRILSDMTVREMTRARCLPDGSGCRSYAFDVQIGYTSARGNLFEPGSTFGHTGFTGTMFWIDPTFDCYVIFLANRVHPDGTGRIVDLRRRVLTVVASAIVEEDTEREPPAMVQPPKPVTHPDNL